MIEKEKRRHVINEGIERYRKQNERKEIES